jgi:hypothetical protein
VSKQTWRTPSFYGSYSVCQALQWGLPWKGDCKILKFWVMCTAIFTPVPRPRGTPPAPTYQRTQHAHPCPLPARVTRCQIVLVGAT